MAEVAGLALGVVALAGVFKDCIDLFSYISAARSLGNDYEILQTMLDVEKTTLLQWAERVRLVNRPHDTRLDEPLAQQIISRVLAGIRLLLSESDQIQKKYTNESSEDNPAPELAPIISGPRMQRFVSEFQALQLRVQHRQGKTSAARYLKWVIRDKEKFEALLQRLSHFTAKLNSLVPDHSGILLTMAKEDVGLLESPAQLDLVYRSTFGRQKLIADAAEKSLKQNAEQRILDSIWFRRMDDRRNTLKDPHSQTLQWALEPPRGGAEWDDLGEWLRSGTGIYWISGKAGSGKSTLMKWMFFAPKTRMFLSAWAADCDLTTASFFFYHLGSEEQKSQEGLARALLFNVLDADHSQIQASLPKMWREVYGKDRTTLDPPSPAEMQDAFAKLGIVAEKNAKKFCFFIDGLDEYSGDYSDGIRFLENLSTSNMVKLVVSSRPISVCVDAFSTRAKLQLQDLTRGDVKKYVDDIIGTHPNMKTLLDVDKNASSLLMQDIAYKASGVFLWVILACRSLRVGLAAGDRISELRARLDALPAELKDLFGHILNKIEPTYRSQAAKLLRICYTSQLGAQPTLLMTLGFAIADEYDMDLEQMPDFRSSAIESKVAKCEIFERRLRSRAWGLLEVERGNPHYSPSTRNWSYLNRPDAHSIRPLLDSNVVFMHRTLVEFLDTPGVCDLDCFQIQDKEFNPNTAISCISLHLAEISIENRSKQSEQYIYDMLYYACLASEVEPTSQNVDRVLTRLAQAFHRESLLPPPHRCPDIVTHAIFHLQISGETSVSWPVLLLAVELGLINFVSSFIASKDIGVLDPIRSYHLLYRSFAHPFINGFPSEHKQSLLQLREFLLPRPLAMMKLLISLGCNPDEEYLNEDGSWTSIWEDWANQADLIDRSLFIEGSAILFGGRRDTKPPPSASTIKAYEAIERILCPPRIDISTAYKAIMRTLRPPRIDIHELSERNESPDASPARRGTSNVARRDQHSLKWIPCRSLTPALNSIDEAGSVVNDLQHILANSNAPEPLQAPNKPTHIDIPLRKDLILPPPEALGIPPVGKKRPRLSETTDADNFQTRVEISLQDMVDVEENPSKRPCLSFPPKAPPSSSPQNEDCQA
jgi:hypothetical protein